MKYIELLNIVKKQELNVIKLNKKLKNNKYLIKKHTM